MMIQTDDNMGEIYYPDALEAQQSFQYISSELVYNAILPDIKALFIQEGYAVADVKNAAPSYAEYLVLCEKLRDSEADHYCRESEIEEMVDTFIYARIPDVQT